MKRVFVLLLMIMVVSACVWPWDNQKDPDNSGDGYIPDTSRYGDFKLMDDVIFIDDKMDDFVEIDGQTVIIKGAKASTKSDALEGYPAELVPGKEDVIFIPLTDKYPEGFMGRVSLVTSDGNDVRLETEDVELTDVFEKLDLKLENVDLGELITSVEDEEGNLLEIEDADDSEWDIINDEEEGDSGESTRAEEEKKRATKKIKFNKIGFEGYLIGEFAVSPEIHIGWGKMTYTIETDVKLGFHLGADITASFIDEDIPLCKPKIMPINFGDLIAFKPFITLSTGLEVSGDLSLKAGMDILALNERTVISNKSGEQTITKESLSDTPEFKWNINYLDMDLAMGIYFAAAIEYGFAKEDMFAVGMEAKAKFTTEADVAISASDESLLEFDPVVSFGPSLEVSAFTKWRIPFTKEQKKVSVRLGAQIGAPITVHLLPKFNKTYCKKDKSSIKVSGDLAPQSFVKSEEQGYAIFKKDSDVPIEHKPCYTSYVPETPITSRPQETVSELHDEVEFSGLAKPEEYECER